MSDPLITIMMPAYNAQVFIAQAIESVLAQTFDDWELIIVDDGSTDSTFEIAASYSDPRIRIIRQDNGGESVARNTALQHMRGDLLAFLDADDQFLPEHLALTTAYLQARPQYHGVYTDGFHCNHDGQKLQPLSANRRGPFEGDLFEELVRASDVFGPPVCLVLRRGLIDDHQLRFDPDIVIGPDWDFNTRYSQWAQFGHIRQHTCLYRIHQTNITVRVGRQRRALSLARCRENAIKLQRFSQCSLETRRAVFYDLLIEHLNGRPQRQSKIVTWPEFRALSAAVQAQLLRLMAAEALLSNETTGARESHEPTNEETSSYHSEQIVHWLQQARRLYPLDWRAGLILAFQRVSPMMARGLIRVWRRRSAEAVSTSPFANVG